MWQNSRTVHRATISARNRVHNFRELHYQIAELFKFGAYKLQLMLHSLLCSSRLNVQIDMSCALD